MKKKSIIDLILIKIFILIIFFPNILQAQTDFTIGIWAFCERYDDFDPIYQDAYGQWHIENSEKQLLLNLVINYIISANMWESEEGLIRFGEEQSGNIKTTIHWAPNNPPYVSTPYEVWRYSYYNSYPSSYWTNRVNNGYTAMHNVFGSSPALHSFFIGERRVYINLLIGIRWNICAIMLTV